MSDIPQGQGWWQADDDKWYPPTAHPDYDRLPASSTTEERILLTLQTIAKDLRSVRNIVVAWWIITLVSVLIIWASWNESNSGL